MSTSQRLFEVIGQTSVNHSAYPICKGMMIGAVAFFVEQLDWLEDAKAKVTGDWGQARFVKAKSGLVRVQLTESNDDDGLPKVLDNVHLAINVKDAAEAALTIEAWAIYAGIGKGCEIEQADEAGKKWFVAIPALFQFKLEFISCGG